MKSGTKNLILDSNNRRQSDIHESPIWKIRSTRNRKWSAGKSKGNGSSLRTGSCKDSCPFYEQVQLIHLNYQLIKENRILDGGFGIWRSEIP